MFYGNDHTSNRQNISLCCASNNRNSSKGQNVTTPTAFPAEHRLILRECLSRTWELETRPAPPHWRRLASADYREQIEFGPRYSSSEFFNHGEPLADADRMRVGRAIAALESIGLIQTHCRFGTRITNIRLTPQGRLIAEQLEAESGVAE